MTQVSEKRNFIKPPTTPLRLFWCLSRGIYIPHELWISTHFRSKFFLRGLLMPILTYRIMNMLTQHPLYQHILLNQPRLPCRIHRPYLSNRLSRKEAVKALLFHYDNMKQFLNVDDLYRLHTPDGIAICAIGGKEGGIYQLKVISTHKLDREGETTVILRDQQNCMLAEISFTLCLTKGMPTLIIGGLQGPNSDDAQARIQKATKAFHGLFPKRIALEALLRLSDLMHIENIYAVATESHVYQSMRYNSRTKHMYADYNALWEMSGGIKMSDGYYRLPHVIKRKEIEELPSKKRSEYRKRFMLLDNIHMQITDAFSPLAKPSG